MAKGNLSIGTLSQDISLIPNEITGDYDGFRAYLKMYLSMTLRISETNKNFGVDFLDTHAKLFLEPANMQLSEVVAAIDASIFDKDKKREIDTGAWLNFPLDDRTIHVIQKIRNGEDVRLRIDFLFTVLTKEGLSLIDNETIWGLEGSRHLRGNIQFAIPKSVWVEKILPSLGFPGFKLIEIPLNHQRLQEAYDNIIAEFMSAENYFNQSDYNKCVAHCRHTLDDLTRNLQKLKKNIESETVFKWLSKIDEATLVWIDTMDKGLTSISSKTHHAGLKRDFTRKEAESIYLITLGLLNFIGQYAGK